MVTIGIGIALILGGIAAWFFKKKKAEKLHILDFSEPKSAAEVLETYTYFKQEYGGGSFSLFVEMNGQAESKEPIIAEFSGRECVYFENKVTREYEVEERYRDSDGNWRTRMARKSEVLSHRKEQAVTFLKDGTGEIEIDFREAELKPIQLFSDFKRGGAPRGFDSYLSPSNTIGFHYEELGIPVRQQLYIIGEANDKPGKLIVSKPSEKGHPFIISTQSEEQIKRGLQSQIKGLTIAAIGGVVIGVGVIVYGIINGLS
jgi:hypothetical protein